MDAIDQIDQPLWFLERWWPTKGRWVVGELHTCQIVTGKLVSGVRPKYQPATYARLLAILNLAVELFPDTIHKADFRLRNCRTNDIVMGAIL